MMSVANIDGKEIPYELFPSKRLDADSNPFGDITIGSGIPEAYRDLVALHEYIEGEGIKNADPPVVRRCLIEGSENRYGTEILNTEQFLAARDYSHDEACKREIEIARKRGILPEYAAWRIDSVKSDIEKVKADTKMDSHEKYHTVGRLEDDIILFGSEIWSTPKTQ